MMTLVVEVATIATIVAIATIATTVTERLMCETIYRSYGNRCVETM